MIGLNIPFEIYNKYRIPKRVETEEIKKTYRKLHKNRSFLYGVKLRFMTLSQELYGEGKHNYNPHSLIVYVDDQSVGLDGNPDPSYTSFRTTDFRTFLQYLNIYEVGLREGKTIKEIT